MCALRRLRVGALARTCPCPTSCCLQHLSHRLTLAPSLPAATLAGRLCSRLPSSDSREDSRRQAAHRLDPGKVRSMGAEGGGASVLCLLVPVVQGIFATLSFDWEAGPWPVFEETLELVFYTLRRMPSTPDLELRCFSQSQPVYTAPSYCSFATLMDTLAPFQLHSYFPPLPLPPCLCSAAKRIS